MVFRRCVCILLYTLLVLGGLDFGITKASIFKRSPSSVQMILYRDIWQACLICVYRRNCFLSEGQSECEQLKMLVIDWFKM